ncbi:Major facilitator superfamily protein [Sphingomonas paucimobilis]|nr:Major facilitator superfamily protein [Sphingomonas paucimobilis]
MKPGSWTSIITIFFVGLIAAASIGKILPLIPDVASSMGVDAGAVSWCISSIAAAAVLLAPLGGSLTERIGDRRLMALGMVIIVAGNVGDYYAPSFASLIVSRLIEGGGCIFVSLGSLAMVARTTTGARQPLAMALISTTVPVGIGLSAALAGFASGPGWPIVFVIHAVAALAGLLLILALAKPQAVQSEHGGTRWIDVLRSRGPIRLSMGLTVLTIAQFGLGALFPTFLIGAFGFSPATAGLFSLASYPASVIGSILLGVMLARNVSARAIFVVTLVIVAIAGPLAYLPVLGLTGAVISLFLFCAAGGTLVGMSAARFPHVAPSPDAIGATSGLMLQFANLGVLLGAPVTFGTFALGGREGVALLALACCVVNGLFWLSDRRITPGANADV